MLKELKRWLRNERQDRTIFDVVVYGSAVKSKDFPSDIDIAVLFIKGTLKERLSKIQSIKKKIKLPNRIDIKGILLEELFQEQFFARSGILLEGISIFDDKPFAHKIGFEGWAMFVYSLRNKTHAQKVKFNYLLRGRSVIGLIKKFEGKHLSPGIILIPIKNSIIFEDIFKSHKIDYSKKNILLER
ncbi:MAG: hypothetical protein AABX08_02180 [Nanoarchaeota archaeon]